MLTKIFSKSRPVHLLISTLIIALGLIFAFIYDGGEYALRETKGIYLIIPLILFSIFLTDLIAKKNQINKNDDYVILLYTIFLLLIPEVFLEWSVVLSSMFILLSFRRLVSLRSHVQVKQKIFDASLWVTVAAIFEFWSILFFALVFISIIIHASNDFRNWIIPIFGFSTVSILLLLYAFAFDMGILTTIQGKMGADFSFEYIANQSQSIHTSTWLTFLIIVLAFQIMAVPSYLAMVQNSIKIVISMLIVGVFVYLFTTGKHEGLWLYCFTPLAIMGSNFISYVKRDWMKEVIVVLLLLLSVFSFVQFLTA